MSTISIGVDLAKSVFSVCEVEGARHVLRRQDLRREAFGIWLAQLVTPFRKVGKITAEHIDETFDTNVKGTIFTVQKALPLMGEGGSIILTGSSAGTTGAPAFSAYSASKAAVRNLAKTWAEDLKGAGIRVDVLSPGPTATELAKVAPGEEGVKAFGSMTPLQRMADPAEIGAVVAFLASPDSSFMTASEVAVDGGLAQI
jgi:NAD(P)-dependent dehydrogenase (short-subunit alcohol dehydrogenase family)